MVFLGLVPAMKLRTKARWSKLSVWTFFVVMMELIYPTVLAPLADRLISAVGPSAFHSAGIAFYILPVGLNFYYYSPLFV